MADAQTTAIAALVESRLNHGLTDRANCGGIVLHELFQAPPRSKFPLLVVARKSWKWESRGNIGHRRQRCDLVLELYLDQPNRERYQESFGTLVERDQWIDEVLAAGRYEDWVDDEGEPLALGDFGIEKLEAKGSRLAFGTQDSEAPKGPLFPALIVELEMLTKYTSFASRERLTRIEGLLTWDGVPEGTYGWHVGSFRVDFPPPP